MARLWLEWKKLMHKIKYTACDWKERVQILQQISEFTDTTATVFTDRMKESRKNAWLNKYELQTNYKLTQQATLDQSSRQETRCA